MSETDRGATPYPGLRPFESDEADVFFGRDEHTDRLLEILQREHFLAAIGPSGSGKSSLVRAGLLPSLNMGSLGSGSDWRIVVLRPGDQPIRSLAAALLQPDVFGRELAGARGADSVDEDVALLAAELRRGPLGLLHVTAGARSSVQRADRPANLLVLVDQFEEIFTYADAGGERADESEAFVNLLLAARADTAARVYVVLTMRTDFLGNCVRFADLPDAINRAQYLTPRLTRAQMERAIVGPAEVFGGSVDRSFVAEVINATGHNSDQLPLLQHALSRMWGIAIARDPEAPRIGWGEATAVGGLAGALDQHAETILRDVQQSIGRDRSHLVQALFSAITERRTSAGGGQDVRRPQTLARIAHACGLGGEWQPLVPIVAAYAAPGVSLLQHGRTLSEASVVDLSHEALMRQWNRLSRWVAAEFRRGTEYRRWAERAIDNAGQRAGLLEGADLARATEWLTADRGSDEGLWTPEAAWAERYAISDNPQEFAQTVAFIKESAAHARRRLDEERDKSERERQQAVERAQAAERAARQARRQSLFIGIVALVMIVLAAATVYFARQSLAASKGAREEATRASLAKKDAERQAAAATSARDRAEKAEKQAVDEKDRAAKAETEALNEKARAEKAELAAQNLAARLDAQLTISKDVQGVGREAAPDVPTAPDRKSPAPAISLADLAAIMPGSREQARAAFLEPLNKAMAEFRIDTRPRQAYFLGQVAYETGNLRFITEIWGPTASQLRTEPPSTIATVLGNTEPGDGKKFRGRGLLAIAGRANYKKFGDALGVDLVGNPDLAAQPDIASRVAAMFWSVKGLNEIADRDSSEGVREITRRINGGVNGLESREQSIARARQTLGISR